MFMKRIINGLAFTLISLPVLAQDTDKKPERWYEVEIILFEQLKPADAESEQWPLDIEHPDISNAIDLLRSPEEIQTTALPESTTETATAIESSLPVETATPVAEAVEASGLYLETPYLILPQQQYQLTDAYQTLADSENYLPLLHIAWRQVIPPRDHPDRIFVHDGLNPVIEDDSLEQTPLIEFEVTPPAIETDFLTEPFEEQNNGTVIATPEHNLSGIISLGLGRYIHVNADLLLYKPQQQNIIENTLPPPTFVVPEPMQFIVDDFEFNPTTIEIEDKKQTPELFRIQGDLRMPSKEVHYLDHPLLGMLILFTPYEVPEPVVIEEPDDISNEQAVTTDTTRDGAIIRPGREVEDRSF